MHVLSTYKENALHDDEEEVQSTKFEIVLELVLSAFFAIDLVRDISPLSHSLSSFSLKRTACSNHWCFEFSLMLFWPLNFTSSLSLWPPHRRCISMFVTIGYGSSLKGTP
jgi:hypothetical protein